MYTGIHSPKSIVGGNKGSSRNLVEYLSKEDNYKEDSEYFSQDGDKQKEDVIEHIDQMGKGLKKDEAKFFMLTINPSAKEQAHILEKITNKKDVSIDDLSQSDKQKYEAELKKFTHKVMDNYAQNFNRVVDGKQITGKDIVYYGKIEYSRGYDSTSNEVKENRQIRKEIKSLNPDLDKQKINDLSQKLHRNSEGKVIVEGMKKEGNQSHIHIVVARYDKDKQTSMSPFANQRKVNDNFGKEIKVGFDRTNFKQMNEQSFDKSFEYSRQKNESFETQNANFKQSKLKVADKEGKVSGVKVLEAVGELTKFAGKIGYTIATSGTGAVKIASPEELGKKVLDFAVNEVKQEVKKINPVEQLKAKLNPVAVVKSTLKKELGTGGFDMEK